MNNIIPTVFATNKKDFDSRLRKLVGISKNIQIDIMDGKFVKSKSIKINQIPNLKSYKNKFEAHLMANAPWNIINELKEKGFKKIIFHFEAVQTLQKARNLVFSIKSRKMQPWIAFNPNTSFGHIIDITKNVQELAGILLMGHTPGVEHEELDQNVIRRIEHIRKISRKVKIQVDGGINQNNIQKLAKVGANYFNVGSFISDSSNPKLEMEKLSLALKK